MLPPPKVDSRKNKEYRADSMPRKNEKAPVRKRAKRAAKKVEAPKKKAGLRREQPGRKKVSPGEEFLGELYTGVALDAFYNGSGRGGNRGGWGGSGSGGL